MLCHDSAASPQPVCADRRRARRWLARCARARPRARLDDDVAARAGRGDRADGRGDVLAGARSEHLAAPGGERAFWSYLTAASMGIGLFWWRRAGEPVRAAAGAFGVARLAVLLAVPRDCRCSSILACWPRGRSVWLTIYLFLASRSAGWNLTAARWLMGVGRARLVVLRPVGALLAGHRRRRPLTGCARLP